MPLTVSLVSDPDSLTSGAAGFDARIPLAASLNGGIKQRAANPPAFLTVAVRR